MNTQPEALRLADALRDGTYLLLLERNATEAELRRLHEANQAMLAVLKWIADQTYDPWTNGAEAQRIAISAIAKGEQQ